MKVGIKNMLSQVYEIEGLLLIADSRGTETPTQVLDMLQEKVAELQANVEAFELPKAEPRQIEMPATHGEQVSLLFDDEEMMSDPVPADEEDLPDDDIEVEFVDEDDPDSFLFKPLMSITEPTEDPDFVPDTEPDFVPDIPEIHEAPSFMDSVAEEKESQAEQIKLDEALQINMTKDLRKAFTLNDRFRYRRELFSNSDLEMNDTLNLVGAMQSYAEAEDYFFNDLQWDKENPDVEDFMAIIKKHFM